MEWQLLQDVPGPQHSSPHTSWPIWNGGEPIIILCVHTHRYEWRSYSPESAVAIWWRNATGNGRKLWQQEKRTDDGQRGKSSVLPCRRYHDQPFESPFS